MQISRWFHSASHAVLSQAFAASAMHEYQARVSSVHWALIVSVIKRSQLRNSEHAAQYAVATGSMGAGPDEEPQPNTRSSNPIHLARRRVIRTGSFSTRS